MIAEAAYLRAERRGFAPGHEHEDWFAAEKRSRRAAERRATSRLSARSTRGQLRAADSGGCRPFV